MGVWNMIGFIIITAGTFFVVGFFVGELSGVRREREKNNRLNHS